VIDAAVQNENSLILGIRYDFKQPDPNQPIIVTLNWFDGQDGFDGGFCILWGNLLDSFEQATVTPTIVRNGLLRLTIQEQHDEQLYFHFDAGNAAIWDIASRFIRDRIAALAAWPGLATA
tara:strand:- start:4 stop:363 length:360 start_codon:yes stop_codon:yes gene_type:complete